MHKNEAVNFDLIIAPLLTYLDRVAAADHAVSAAAREGASGGPQFPKLEEVAEDKFTY